MRFCVPVVSPLRSRRPGESLARPDPALDEGSDWIGLGEASRLLGISEGTLRRWADEGRLAVFTTPGGHRRFSRQLLRSLLPADRSRRPKLARADGASERIVQAYRPSRLHIDAPSWIDRLEESDRDAFRGRGRALVNRLLEHLDADDAEAARGALQAGCQLASEHGRQMAALGASMADAVELFLAFRRPFIAELARLARARTLDARETSALFVQAEAAMDRLLVATMTGHSLGRGEAVGDLP